MRLFLGLMFATVTAVAVAAQTDTIPATGGDIQITPMMRMSVQIEHAGIVIHVDPTAESLGSQGKPADLILVTDIHPDNYDPDQIAKLRKPGAVVVMPEAVATLAAGTIATPTRVVSNGETVTVGAITVEAVAMYNVQRGPKPGEAYQPKGRGNGYLVTVGGTRLYFAGKTECTPEMKALEDIEVAFVPLQMPETMPPFEAGECVTAFQPKTVYVYRYAGQKNDEAFFRAVLKPTPIVVHVNTEPAEAAPVPLRPGPR
jgi:L-ascorbate metabolism protein UlaG (beta-lactamase superfamily)